MNGLQGGLLIPVMGTGLLELFPQRQAFWTMWMLDAEGQLKTFGPYSLN